MHGKRRKLAVTLPVLALLSWHGCTQAFSFCFSFGGRDSQRTQHNRYLPPLPANLPGLYGGYPYSPAPEYSGYRGYYARPYGMPATEPVPGNPDPGLSAE